MLHISAAARACSSVMHWLLCRFTAATGAVKYSPHCGTGQLPPLCPHTALQAGTGPCHIHCTVYSAHNRKHTAPQRLFACLSLLLPHLLRLRPLLWLRSRRRASAADVSMPMPPSDLRSSLVVSLPRVLCFRGITGLQVRNTHHTYVTHTLHLHCTYVTCHT